MKKNENKITNGLLQLAVLFAVLLAAVPLRAQQQEAQQSYSFSLQEAIQHAQQYNRSVINSGRDVEAAYKRKWETIAGGLPQISASGYYQNNFELQKQIIPAEFFGGPPGTFTEIAFGTKHTADANATLNQLIFDGTYIVGLKAAKTYLDFYKTSKIKTDIEIREQVINAYGNVLLTQENIDILNKNKQTLQKNLFEAEQMFKNGLGEEEDAEQISITLASVNSSLNNSERLRNITLDMLKVLLGIDLKDSLQLTDDLEALTNANLDMTITGAEFNVENNIDYRLGVNNTEQKYLLMQQERSKALPTLSTNLTFGYNAFNDDFAFTQREQRWLNYSYLGVSLNVPIFSSFARSARTQQAKIELEKAKTELTELEQNLKLQYERAKSNYEYSVEEYMTSKNSLRLAERIEDKQQIKFREGLSTSFEFSEAQRQLYTAQQNYLQSMVDVINAKAALEKLTAR